MSVPKKRKSRSRARKNKAGKGKVAAIKLIKCANCSAAKRPHAVCLNCGHYKGRLVLNVEHRKKRLERKHKGGR